MRPDSTALLIGDKTFTEDDQQLFASVSRDHNPLHVDAIVARRLVTGRQVVHGVHVLITAIELWQREDDCPLDTMRCVFSSPISVADKVEFTQRREGDSAYMIDARVDGLLCTQIVISTSKDAVPGRLVADGDAWSTGAETRIPADLDSPLDDKPEAHLNRNYIVGLNDTDYSIKFPRAYLHLGKNRFAGIAALSRFVGMICPGLHSIFSSLTVESGHGAATDDVLAFRVRKYDYRSHLFDIRFQGCVQGSIRAFLRPRPQEQPTLKELSGRVLPQEFRGTRTLVVGGSRGLGELTAKVLAAGGGAVVITYASGLEDAERIRDEINSDGRGTCDVLKVDLTKDAFDTLNLDFGTLNAVYYFATPRIYRKKADTFDPRTFHEFCDMYIGKFYDLCAHLEAVAPKGSIKVFFPSSVFVSERPRGMAEYAMAKAAAEVLLQEINRVFKRVSLLSTRLPRLNTDQTSTILKIPTESNLETLLPIVRSVSGAGMETQD